MRSVYGFDSSRLYNKSRCDLATYRQCLMKWHFILDTRGRVSGSY